VNEREQQVRVERGGGVGGRLLGRADGSFHSPRTMRATPSCVYSYALSARAMRFSSRGALGRSVTDSRNRPSVAAVKIGRGSPGGRSTAGSRPVPPCRCLGRASGDQPDVPPGRACPVDGTVRAVPARSARFMRASVSRGAGQSNGLPPRPPAPGAPRELGQVKLPRGPAPDLYPEGPDRSSPPGGPR
jgi:hypothetical protein